MDWMHMGQDGYKWWAIVNTHIFRFHKLRGIPRLTEEVLASEEGLCCMELVVS